MVALKLSAFGGMIPAQDDHLLPENNAALAQNTFLDSGALQGLHVPRAVYTLLGPGNQFVFRIPLVSTDKDHISASFWLEFVDPDTNVLKTPVADDSFERFYFASPTVVPKYNTKTRILAGSAPFTLGIPTPETAPGVAVVGGSGTTEARSYVYTWSSAYAEEGPPSPPTLVTGFINGTWNITLTAPLTADTTGRNLTRVRIYRTVTNASGGATFFLLVDQAIGTTTYADTTLDVVLAGNALLESTDWGGPPADLQGFVSMPNGMIAGWRANEIWFCEPFRPHAWPAAYTTSVDNTVVGLGVVGQTLVVLTQGFPYAATGVSPINMAFSKIATFEPCMSRGSIISTAQGVLYASPNGIVLAAYGIVQNASQQLATKDRWLDLVTPQTLRAVRLGASYYAWGVSSKGSFEPTAFENTAFVQDDYTGAFTGVLVNLADPRVAWVELDSNMVLTNNVLTDLWSGEIFLIRGGKVYWMDMSSDNVDGPYLWRSKVFQLDQPRNLAALKVRFLASVKDSSFTLNPVRDTSSPQTLKSDQYGILRVYAGENLIATRELRVPGELIRLPSGFKEEFWQFEIEARVPVYSLQVATSVKELSGI